MSRRTISNDIKEELFVRQFGCCNNRPGNTDTSFSIPGKGKYMCPMWKANEGKFDESGYEADHILEHSLGGSDEISNLQLICPCCHSYKTKLFTRQPMVEGIRGYFDSEARGRGQATMEELNKSPIQRRKRLRPGESMDLGFGKKRLNDFNYLIRLK